MDLNEFKTIAKLASKKLMSLNDEESLKNKTLYLNFEKLIGKTLPLNYKFVYENKLYKTIKDNLLVEKENVPSENTSSLYAEIIDTSEGNYENPILYNNNNIVLEEGKYYTQNNVIYKCIQTTENIDFKNLKDLINVYVLEV